MTLDICVGVCYHWLYTEEADMPKPKAKKRPDFTAKQRKWLIAMRDGAPIPAGELTAEQLPLMELLANASPPLVEFSGGLWIPTGPGRCAGTRLFALKEQQKLPRGAQIDMGETVVEMRRRRKVKGWTPGRTSL